MKQRKKKRTYFDWRFWCKYLVVFLLLEIPVCLVCLAFAGNNFTERNTYYVSGVCTNVEVTERGAPRGSSGEYITITLDGEHHYFVKSQSLWYADYNDQGKDIREQLYGKQLKLGVRDVFFSLGGNTEIGSIETEDGELLSLAKRNAALDADEWVANMLFVFLTVVVVFLLTSFKFKRTKRRKKREAKMANTIE